MNNSTFNPEYFLSLNDSDVVEYTEPFLTQHAEMIPASACAILANNLDQMSNVKTVYVLEICMRLAPEKFASQTVKYLSHGDSAVCCTASRVLERLPPDLLSAELMEQISKTPLVPLFTSNVRTGEQLQIGTNEELVRKLLNSLDERRID